MPEDQREIDAVMRAGTLWCNENPYIVERYGSRGEAFTRSDGGYLALLAGFPESYIREQMSWLASVLSSRGMPCWLMELYLDSLVNELGTAIPERKAEFQKLKDVEQTFRSSRLAWISQADFDALVAEFESTTGHALRNSGGLLVSAVCDELSGLPQSVSSLTSWLADPDRFPPEWCTAVAETVARARSLASSRNEART